MKNRILKNIYLSIFLFWVLGSTLPVLADGPNDYLRTRTYLGFVGTSVSIDNSTLFSGKNYSVLNATTYEIDLIPKLDQNFGFGVLVGRREEAYAMEISYWQSNHTASFGPASLTSSGVTTPVDFPLTQDTAVIRSVNLDFKRFFFTEQQIQPYINLGVSFPWIVVNNGAEDVSGNFSSLTLAGLGLDLGIGLEYYFTPNLSIFGTATQRWASFDQYKSFAAQYTPLTPYGGVASDSGSGLNFTIGTTIGIQ